MKLTVSFLPSVWGAPGGAQAHSSKLDGIGCCPALTMTPSTRLTWDAVNNEQASAAGAAAQAACVGIEHRQNASAASKISAIAGGPFAGMISMSTISRADVIAVYPCSTRRLPR